ncbi:MAG: cbb3-type cytochrome oxidase assembly protein CcoS [bacterium]|nr:cbb3-type cytochrome oxidase assembly protein CcoS [bacterium]
MDVIIVLVLISLVLVALGLLFFFSRLYSGDFEHGERLSLLPLADDEAMIEQPGEPGTADRDAETDPAAAVK